MPEITVMQNVIQPPRVHGWTLVMHRTVAEGPWHGDAVFESSFAAGIYAGTLLQLGMAVEVNQVEVRFSEGED